MNKLWIACIFISSVTSAFSCDQKPITEHLGVKVSFIPPQLKATCAALKQSLRQHDHGEAYLKNGASVDTAIVIGLFQQIALFDLEEGSFYDTYLKSCGDLSAFTWKPKNDTSLQNWVQKYVYESNYGDSSQGTYVIEVVDFAVGDSTKPNHIRMRTVNDEIESVSVDGNTYIRVSEMYLLGNSEAQAALDSAKGVCR